MERGGEFFRVYHMRLTFEYTIFSLRETLSQELRRFSEETGL